MSKVTMFKFNGNGLVRYEDGDDYIPLRDAEVFPSLPAAKQAYIKYLEDEIEKVKKLKLKDLE